MLEPFVCHPVFQDDSFNCCLSETSVILLYFQHFASFPSFKYPSGKEGITLYSEAPGIWAITIFRFVKKKTFSRYGPCRIFISRYRLFHFLHFICESGTEERNYVENRNSFST